MDDAGLQSNALEYLRGHSVMTLATHGSQGLWAAAVFYASEGFTLYFLSSPESRHGRNLQDNASVAATIQEDCSEWRQVKGIQLEGEATRIAGAERANAIARYALKFPIVANLTQAPAEIVDALSRIAWYRLVPSRLYFIDNSHAFSHRLRVL